MSANPNGFDHWHGGQLLPAIGKVSTLNFDVWHGGQLFPIAAAPTPQTLIPDTATGTGTAFDLSMRGPGPGGGIVHFGRGRRRVPRGTNRAEPVFRPYVPPMPPDEEEPARRIRPAKLPTPAVHPARRAPRLPPPPEPIIVSRPSAPPVATHGISQPPALIAVAAKSAVTTAPARAATAATYLDGHPKPFLILDCELQELLILLDLLD